MMKSLLTGFLLISSVALFSQYKSNLSANDWVDSVFRSLNKKQRIAQLMVVRAHSNLGPEHVASVTQLINKYRVGGLCFFQGGPVRQANLTNYYQSISKTPLLVTIDGEWGLGMRLDSVINFQRQMTIGAIPDAGLVYKFGQAVAKQCKRLGIQLNFAPDVDINNNPANPVINDRSFGEDKYKVALFGVQYMKGMQDAGVMACAKHFPGHGDVSVDSHLDLPVINKTRSQLDSLELYPFQQMIKEGTGSIMSAHLYVPAIDTISNQATSLSYNNVTGLLKNELGFTGLTFTDALEMKGVTKFYPAGEASVQSLIAGNDMLCLPEDIPGSIKKIRKAIRRGELKRKDIKARVKKVLLAKYNLGLNEINPIKTEGLVDDLNTNTFEIKRMIAESSVTLIKLSSKDLIPVKAKKVAFLGIGIDSANAFAKRLQQDYGATIFTYNYKKDSSLASPLPDISQGNFDLVIIGMHNYSRRPANQFGISNAAFNVINEVQSQLPTITFVFGNPYAIKNIASTSSNLVACYEDDDITQQVAADVLQGKILPKGKLPVTVSDQLHFGTGIVSKPYFPMVLPESVGLQSNVLNSIDSIANDAIMNHATPGCVVLVAKDGKVAFQRAYGYTNYDSIEPVKTDMMYDLASVTKISATTVSVMKLYEEGKLDIDKTLGDYLLWVKGSNKENIPLRNLLLHQAQLVPYIPFYKETIDTTTGRPLPSIYSHTQTKDFSVKVAEDLYLRNDWHDTMYHRILLSKLGEPNKYVYSDNDFIFLGKIVEAITRQKLEDYVKQTFYAPLGMTTTGFKPRDHFPINSMAPTENDTAWRQQLLRGDVHDPGAAMFGGVAGHAGLFSNAYDLAQLYQMLLNGGELNGIRYLRKETIDKFTAYSSNISRRGLGFDKPEKDNTTRIDPYPSSSVSPLTFGHTGFTGTCVWVDPAYNLVYIFLSNRVTPNGENNKLLKMNVRSNIQDIIYDALQSKSRENTVSKPKKTAKKTQG